MIHLLAALRPDGRAPTDGEARLAAAVFAVHDGRMGAVPLALPDRLAARQLAVVAAFTPGSGPASVWGAVFVAALALGALTAVLMWGVVRRLGCGPLPSALAVVVVGVTPMALALHSGVTAAAVAVPWLLVAALLCWRGRALGIVAGAAAALAVLTAPLIGAVLLALAAHWMADRTMAGTVRSSRGIPLTAALGGAAAGLAAASAGSGPLAGQAAPVVTTGAAIAGAVCGLLAVVAGWRIRWVRPLLTPAIVVLAVLLVPGPGRAAAALTALALFAVVTAAVADDAIARVPAESLPVLRPALAAGIAVMAVVGLPDNPASAASTDSAPAPLLAWAADPGTAGAMLHADPLDRAELVVAGFPPERLRDLDGPVADADVLLLAGRPHAGTPVDTPVHCASGTLLATVPRAGAAPAEICDARAAAPDPEPAERASRVRIGTALAGNPSLQLDPAAADLLRQGAVDPRIMIVLAALAGGHTLTVPDFPPAMLEPAGTLRRQVLVTAVDGAPVGAEAPSSLREWFRGQLPPYAPAVIRDDPSGLLVGYRDTPPAGLLPT
ncbi:MAG: hypothetical protein QOK35_1171 [Pseudonocardiales bacterium]|nr:hypothetical protein [Pseudonocardiales bacterium]